MEESDHSETPGDEKMRALVEAAAAKNETAHQAEEAPVDDLWEIHTVSSAAYEDDAQVLVMEEHMEEVMTKIDGYEDHLYNVVDSKTEVLPYLDATTAGFAVAGDWRGMLAAEELQQQHAEMGQLYKGGHIFLGRVGEHGGVCEVVLRNNTKMEWPADTKLRMVCGDGCGVAGAKDAFLGVVGPKECVGLQFNFGPGYLQPGFSYWVLESQRLVFGQMLIFERV